MVCYAVMSNHQNAAHVYTQINYSDLQIIILFNLHTLPENESTVTQPISTNVLEQ